MVDTNNQYTLMQKVFYDNGTTNHEVHNDNPDYWNILLSDLKNSEFWENKNALDFGCGKGRNVYNLLNLCNWKTVDGVDISIENIKYCSKSLAEYSCNFYCNNGIDVSELKSNYYDFVMSTIVLQHIPVYDIRKSLILDIYRVMKKGGIFSFQMGYGYDLSDTFGRQRSSYYDNKYDAIKTNSEHDVRILNEFEVVEDLSTIGFENITTTIRDSFSDYGHPKWIYVRAQKP